MECFNGLLIEIQLRSPLQHAWATALETVDAFTHQSLKSGGGELRWRRFFALMGAVLALREQTAPVPETPTDEQLLREELREINHELGGVAPLLHGWRAGIQIVQEQSAIEHEADWDVVLLDLDIYQRTLRVTAFPTDFHGERALLALERQIEADRETEHRRGTRHAVLVGVTKFKHLQRAFPNYSADLDSFGRVLHEVLLT
jgi:hypothetical protein